MATANQIISLALSKIGIAGGIKAARPEDLALGLTTLQALYRHYISSGALGRAKSKIAPQGDYVACENDRILRLDRATTSITLPAFVKAQSRTVGDYGDDVDYGVGAYTSYSGVRPPRHASFVVINDDELGQSTEYIYDGYVDRWIRISDLTLDDDSEAPLASNLDGMAARLAVMLADHYEATVQPMTAKAALMFDAALVQAMGEHEDTIPGRYY